MRNQAVNALYGLLLLFFVIAAFACFSFGYFMPYKSVVQWISSYSYTGHIEYFTEEYYAGVLWRMQCMGTGLSVFICVLFVFRKRIDAAILLLRKQFRGETSAFLHWLFDGKGNRLDVAAFWFIVLVGVAIRGLYINQEVHADEARTFSAYAFRPFYIIVSDWTAPNNHIFHTLLVRLCYLLFGRSLLVLRFPSFMAGILFLPLSYLFVKKLFSRGTGLFVMAFCAASYGIVSFSTMGRGYTILFCCTYILFLLALSLRVFPNNITLWVTAVGVSAIGMFTIPTMLYSIVGISVWLALNPPVCFYRGSELWRWWFRLFLYLCLTGLLTLLLYSPAFVATDWSLIHDDAALTSRRTWQNILTSIPAWSIQLQRLAIDPMPRWMAYGLTGCGLAGLSWLYREGRLLSKTSLLVCVVLASFVIPICVQRVIPYTRVYIVYIPFVAAFLFYGVSRLLESIPALETQRKYYSYIGVTIFTAIMAIALIKQHGVEYLQTGDQAVGARGAAEFLASHAKERDVAIALCPVPGPLIFYLSSMNNPIYVYDTLQYTPIIEKGSNTAWIVISREHAQSMQDMRGRIKLMVQVPDIQPVYENGEIFIVELQHIRIGGYLETGN
ncbi:MAG: glycosyltransferase family 39 protein [Kiritimatiellae bacterium]|nr:glycosyltransferase family 39 protein [Kiritimatiellia bacterium]